MCGRMRTLGDVMLVANGPVEATAWPDATHVLVVDPIDGTRPAMAGLESACVAVMW